MPGKLFHYEAEARRGLPGGVSGEETRGNLQFESRQRANGGHARLTQIGDSEEAGDVNPNVSLRVDEFFVKLG